MKYLQDALNLKKELDKLRPISPEKELKIIQKFRLDWNYHSNHLEGNSLTFGETKMLILHGVTAGGKPLKDSLEVKGHDDALKWVEEVVKGDFPLTETFIRQLHVLLLKESYEVSAITPDGRTTSKRVEVGKYKTSPNHVKTKSGEIFYFSNPEETPAKMNDLLLWYRKEIESGDVNPIILAAQFHYKFVLIHPFDDGNGRVARILMNFILMRFGFSPVIIKTEDKENYFSALVQADGGLIEKFIEYISENLVSSLSIMIAGARGEDIEEDDDLDKQIALLKMNFDEHRKKTDNVKSTEAILKIYDDSVLRIYNKFMKSCQKFDEFYLDKKSNFLVDDQISSGNGQIIDNVRNRVEGASNVENIRMYYLYKNFNHQGQLDASFFREIELNFGLESYELSCYSGKYPSIPKVFGSYTQPKSILKTYGQQVTDEELSKMLKLEDKNHYELIKKKLDKV